MKHSTYVRSMPWIAALCLLGCALVLWLGTGCGHARSSSPPMLREGCRGEEAFCAEHTVIAALNPDEIYSLQVTANEWFDANVKPGAHLFPRVVWHPCFFSVGKRQQCAAGWTRSQSEIHISTAEWPRTLGLIKHETIHARYCALGDCDADHERKYGW